MTIIATYRQGNNSCIVGDSLLLYYAKNVPITTSGVKITRSSDGLVGYSGSNYLGFKENEKLIKKTLSSELPNIYPGLLGDELIILSKNCTYLVKYVKSRRVIKPIITESFQSYNFIGAAKSEFYALIANPAIKGIGLERIRTVFDLLYDTHCCQINNRLNYLKFR